MAEDVIYFETSLDDISAFQYENYLKVLERLIRGTSNPLVQVAKRLQEYEAVHREAIPLSYQFLNRPNYFSYALFAR